MKYIVQFLVGNVIRQIKRFIFIMKYIYDPVYFIDRVCSEDALQCKYNIGDVVLVSWRY